MGRLTLDAVWIDRFPAIVGYIDKLKDKGGLIHRYRMAKMPYLYRSFSAKEPYF